MRKNILAGNWKMNTDIPQGMELVKTLSENIKNINFNPAKFGIVVAPPFTHLYAVSQVLEKKIGLSAQNIAAWESGAYTGEVAASMLISAGAQYTIIGHSERRTYFAENNELLATKVKIALKNNLIPIFCIGEVLKEREDNIHFQVVKQQIEEGLFILDKADFQKVVIAYEPVWAIGTGKTATPEQAQEMHAYIRKLISEKFGTEIADNTSLLYGGSCNPSNGDGLFAKPDIDGGLIGGASLKAADFLKLFEQLLNNK